MFSALRKKGGRGRWIEGRNEAVKVEEEEEEQKEEEEEEDEEEEKNEEKEECLNISCTYIYGKGASTA
ncbi:hypothetical protein V1477_000433 [Vespula maculifrons]|uniref:Uncharacterized protein n=1 Tax=Vespula maculifrons TaxID=7453 RepID=A0ABD2D1L4_VESMC